MMRHWLSLMVAGALALATPAYADLKCGDAPFAFGQDDLVVTWIGPVPKSAKVRYVDDEIFTIFERQMGPEIPAALPEKYRKDLRRVDLSNAQISSSVDEAASWLKRYGIALEAGPAGTFRNYINRGNLIYSTLIDHPPVFNFVDFAFCSIILQRGIIVMSEGTETLYLRSYFHSTDGKGTAVNFAPKGGLKISFPSKTAWFPLELTKHIFEPSAHVVLDVVTPQPARLAAPSPFRVVSSNQKIGLGAQDYFVTRFTAVLEKGKDWPDFSVELGK
jgi:hypothetical protein